MTLLQNWHMRDVPTVEVSLPVRVALLQNAILSAAPVARVSLPVRVALLQNGYTYIVHIDGFHYQSGWHYSKTLKKQGLVEEGFITSQGGTTPKPNILLCCAQGGFITSQGGTTPKLATYANDHFDSFITSQGGTTPKPLKQNPHCKGTFSLTDFDV